MQAYNYIDQHIHQLSQIITKVNRTFVPKEEDDSHTNLYFDSIVRKVYGRWINTHNGKKILALNLQSFSFEWINDALGVIQSHVILNKTSVEIEQSISNGLSEIGLEENDFRKRLHFEITEYPFLNESFSNIDANDLTQWEYYRALANQACFALLGLLQAQGEIRIWPHHFDTGIYVEPKNNLSLGFGLAMEDSMVGNPYFYFSGNGQNEHTINYSNTSHLTAGHWVINDHWKGATLPLPELTNDDSKTINMFFKEVTKWFLKN
jgi:hypothetical protein